MKKYAIRGIVDEILNKQADVGFLMQDSTLLNLTICKNLLFGETDAAKMESILFKMSTFFEKAVHIFLE